MIETRNAERFTSIKSFAYRQKRNMLNRELSQVSVDTAVQYIGVCPTVLPTVNTAVQFSSNLRTRVERSDTKVTPDITAVCVSVAPL